MSTCKCMKLTQKAERERASARTCFYESCISKQILRKYCHLYFQEPCALTNHTEETHIVLYSPGNYTRTQAYVRLASELHQQHGREQKPQRAIPWVKQKLWDPGLIFFQISCGLDLSIWVGKASMPCDDLHAIAHYRAQVDLVVVKVFFDQKKFYNSMALSVYRLS